MQGAREYCQVFTKPEQIGRLFIWPSEHARGKTIEMWIVPEGYDVLGGGYPKLTNDCVKVYDAISGQRGWTETYGWLHRGKWVEDFEILYRTRFEQQTLRAIQIREAKLAAESAEREAKRVLLASYN